MPKPFIKNNKGENTEVTPRQSSTYRLGDTKRR